MKFLKTVGSSIHSPQFYSKVPERSFKQSIIYFLLLILLLTTIRLITLINPLLIESPKALQGFAQDLINCFPKDLEVKVTNGQTSLNAQEPYFVSCKSDQPLVVIDTKTPYTSSKFYEYKVAAWLTKDTVYYKRSDVETRSYILTKIKDFKLNKEVINTYYTMFLPYLKFVGPILMLLTFMGIYLSYNFRLIHLLIVALLVWLLSKAFKQDLSYGSSYKISLYAITLGLIVELVVNLTARWTYFYGFPFMVTILTLTVVLVNFLLPKKAS